MVIETTALGAVYAAGLAVSFWRDFDELRANWGKECEWQPQMDASKRESLYAGWEKPSRALSIGSNCLFVLGLSPKTNREEMGSP